MTIQPPTAEILTEIRDTAGALQASLAELVEAATGPTLRPATLSRALGLDKSIASRIVRAVRAGTPYEFMHFVPSPAGLKLLTDAAAGAGVSSTNDSIDTAISRFQALLDSLPGGRADLEVVLADKLGELRERHTRTAQQAFFRSASSILGYQCDGLASALILTPSEAVGFIDATEVQHRVNVRLLRPTAAIGLLRVTAHTGGDSAPAVETLDGQSIDNPAHLILPAFGDSPLPELEVHRAADEISLILKSGADVPRRAVTLTSGLVLRRALRTQRGSSESRSYLLHIPCRRVVRDIFVHTDCKLATPECTFEFPRPDGLAPERQSGILGQIGAIDVPAPTATLGRGIGQTGIHGMPQYQGALTEAFERTGKAPSDYRHYRIDVTHPIPFVYMVIWLT